MSNFVNAQEILNYCDANIARLQKQVNEWLEHTLEYKESHDYIVPLRERIQTLEDVKRFVNGLPYIHKAGD